MNASKKIFFLTALAFFSFIFLLFSENVGGIAFAESKLPQYSFTEPQEKISGKSPINREKFLRWTLNNAGFSAKRFSGGREPFIDIKRNQEIFPFVASAYASGALDEFAKSKKFLPHKKITRIEALQILFAIEGISPFQKYQKKSSLLDLPLDQKEKLIIIKAENSGFISANTKNLVFPYARLTEQDAITMLQKISYHKKKAISHPQRKTPSDIEKTEALILNKYLKKSEISREELEGEALDGMMKSLDDRYSVYMPPKKAENFNNFIDGKATKTSEYVGIGVAIMKKKEGGIILTEIFDGPAKKKGLQEGDEITHVNGKDIADESTSEIVNQIKGKAGTSVKLTISRISGSKTYHFVKTVTRGKINLSSQIGGMQTTTTDDITWVKFRAFQSTTAQDFKLSLEKNISEKTKGLVIDLRYNPGGLLSASQRMLGELLPENNVAVRLKNDNGEQIVKVKGSGKFTKIPLVVIQNEYSASASEIFAGAIQDYERGTIIGKNSFGKGVAQNLYSLRNGGQIKLTTNEFLTPLGHTVHHQGITPDIEVNNTDDASLLKVVKRILR